jgi:hypothetical protein
LSHSRFFDERFDCENLLTFTKAGLVVVLCVEGNEKHLKINRETSSLSLLVTLVTTRQKKPAFWMAFYGLCFAIAR